MPISCARKLSDKQFRAVEWQNPGRLTAGQVHHRAPVFSPDGRWLCLLSGDAAEAVWLVCDHKGRPSRVLAGPAAGGASFGRDLSLAYGRQVGATEEIWQLAAGARRAKRLLGGDGLLYRDPAHSPCGRYLAFAAALEDAPTRLHVLDLRSGAKVILPVPPGLEEASLGRPAWSPALDRIFFEAVQGEEVAVYTQELAVGTGGLAEAPGRCLRLTPEGERQRRPAPLSPEMNSVRLEPAMLVTVRSRLADAGRTPPAVPRGCPARSPPARRRQRADGRVPGRRPRCPIPA